MKEQSRSENIISSYLCHLKENTANEEAYLTFTSETQKEKKARGDKTAHVMCICF